VSRASVFLYGLAFVCVVLSVFLPPAPSVVSYISSTALLLLALLFVTMATMLGWGA
jgi:hypothetical protein